MALFNFFSEQEHRGFHYTPRYYDPEKEERKRLFGQVDGSVDRDKEKGEYVPGSYLHGAFRDGNYATRRSHSTKAQKYIAMMQDVAQGKDNKVVYLPYEASNLMGSIGGIKDLFQG